jgi:CTP:molybdopterin cytidylyltransferase MocA
MGQAKLLLPWGDTTVIGAVLNAWRVSRVSHVIVVVHPDDAELAARCRAGGAMVVLPEVPPPEMRVSVQVGLRYVREQFHPAEDDAWLLAPADMPLIKPSTIDQLIDAHAESSRLFDGGQSRGMGFQPVGTNSDHRQAGSLSHVDRSTVGVQALACSPTLPAEAGTPTDRSWTSGLSSRPIIVPVTESASQDAFSPVRRRGHPVLFPWPLAAAVEALPAEAGVNRLLQQHDVLELPVRDLALDDLDTPAEYERLRLGATKAQQGGIEPS